MIAKLSRETHDSDKLTFSVEHASVAPSVPLANGSHMSITRKLPLGPSPTTMNPGLPLTSSKEFFCVPTMSPTVRLLPSTWVGKSLVTQPYSPGSIGVKLLTTHSGSP